MRTGKTIYLDHQATTPTHPDVLAAMRPWLTEAFGNPHSSDHALGWKSSQAVDKAAEQVARLIGADADEITVHVGRHRIQQYGPAGVGSTVSRGQAPPGAG